MGVEPFSFFAGRLIPQKAVDVLVEAFARLSSGYLLIAGEGKESPMLEQKAKDLGVSDRVFLLGLRDDIPGLMKAADCFVLPSRYEGLPIVVLEAMGAGLPVILSDFSAARGMLRDGQDGIIVPREDVAALAEAIEADGGSRSEKGVCRGGEAWLGALLDRKACRHAARLLPIASCYTAAMEQLSLSPEKERIAKGYDDVAARILMDPPFYDRCLGMHSPYQGNVLDIGCGQGFLLQKVRSLSSPANLFGVDISDKLCSLAAANNPSATIRRADAEALPFEDNTFDIVLMTEVLEHLLDYDKAVSEASRVLKKAASSS